jgi:hypothetical protein
MESLSRMKQQNPQGDGEKYINIIEGNQSNSGKHYESEINTRDCNIIVYKRTKHLSKIKI